MTIGVILGAAVWADGPSPALRRRALHGAMLLRRGDVDRLVLCGGMGKHAPTEAEAMRVILLAEGVPHTSMMLEDRSTTTGENIRNAAALIGKTDVTLITDWYHAPRARMIARGAGLAANSASPAIKGAQIWPQTKMALREGPAFLAYALGLKR